MVIVLLSNAKAQIVNSKYYLRKQAEKETLEKPKWIDIYVDSPLYVGITNKVKIQGINLDELQKDNFGLFTETNVKGEYNATFIAPGNTSLSFRSKLTGRTMYVYHYRVARLREDALKKEPEVIIGSVAGTKIGALQLKSTKDITITNGFKLISGQVYFSGAGFPAVYTISMPGFSTKLDSVFNICIAGSQITFDNVKVADSAGKAYITEGKTYTVITDAEVQSHNDNSITELNRLINLNFIRGTIYFSGEKFNNVQSVSGKEINPQKFFYWQRCAPGSVITFENCVYVTDIGTTVLLPNKSIKLE